MSTLLEQASLVMIPSGYKEDVVYSQIPTSGAGDLSFTRASNGTRINSAGLVEVVAWNLASYSEDFSNAAWSKANTTITANDTTAPNGTTTADKFAPNGTLTSTYFSISQEVVSGATSQAHTAIIYAKAGGLTQMLVYLGNSIGVYWNLSNGQFISYYSGAQTITNYSSEAVGDGWYKYTISISVNSASTYLEVYGAKSGAFIGNYTTADNCFIWGAQLNIGSTAKPYFPTTDRLNVPRLTYQNGGGGCPSLLLEKQSTNLLSYSEQIQNSDWNAIGGDLVVTGNAVISPDGTQNAGAITLANSANRYFVHNPFSITGGVAYTYSVWMKSASGNLSINMGGVNGLAGVLKTVTTEWQRFTYTFTPSTTYLEYFGFDNRAAGSSTSGTLYFWGAQVEQSSYPTSYIPTTSSSATRVGDVCFKTGISSLIGQSQGTFFVDVNIINPVTPNGNWHILMVGSASERITIYSSGTSTINTDGTGSGGGFTPIVGALTLGRNKIAVGYANNDVALYVNGTLIGTRTTATIPSSMSQVDVGGNYTYANYIGSNTYNEVVFFPTRLTNAQLASLTTL